MIRFSPLVAHFILLRNSANRSSFDTSSKVAIAAAPAGFCFSIALLNLCTTQDPFSASAFSSAATNSLFSLLSCLLRKRTIQGTSNSRLYHRLSFFKESQQYVRTIFDTWTIQITSMFTWLWGSQFATGFFIKIKLKFLLYNNLIEKNAEFFPEL